MAGMGAALDSYMAGVLSAVHTSMPAGVVKYDQGKHRATVKPSVRMLMDNGIQVEIPELMDVPVIFPSSQFFDMEFPIDKGDMVLLVFQEQDISGWKKGDALSTPATPSRFSLDAAVAIPGLFARPVKGKARIVVGKDGVVTWEATRMVFNEQVIFNKGAISRDDIYIGQGLGPGVSVLQHVHPTNVGPSGAPTPSTPIPPEEQ